MNYFPPVITIDGPSGSGKGTLSKKLASMLKWNILDSGIIYRMLALIALNNYIDISNEIKLAEIASAIKITFINKLNKFLIFYNNREITQDILYTEVIGNVASKIAVFPKVREILLEYQRSFCVFPGLVADGRDMGTVIFPNAVLKVFLNASVKVREQRRLLQLKNRLCNVNLKFLILKNIQERDERDYNRKLAPLLPAVDALVLDSTYLSSEEIKFKVFAYIKKNMLLPLNVLYNTHS